MQVTPGMIVQYSDAFPEHIAAPDPSLCSLASSINYHKMRLLIFHSILHLLLAQEISVRSAFARPGAVTMRFTYGPLSDCIMAPWGLAVS
jgi:hypothetical protein